MSKEDWALVEGGGQILLAIVAIHGISSQRWREAHTIGVLLWLTAAFGPRL